MPIRFNGCKNQLGFKYFQWGARFFSYDVEYWLTSNINSNYKYHFQITNYLWNSTARHSFLFCSVFSYRKDENHRFFSLKRKKKQVTRNIVDLLLSCLYHESPEVLHSIMTERKVTESDSAKVSFSWAASILIDTLLTWSIYKSLSHKLMRPTILLCEVSSKLLSSGLYSTVQMENSI